MASVYGTCRLCSEETTSQVDLFEATESGLAYLNLVEEFLQVQLVQLDDIYSVICQKCIEILDSVRELKRIVLEAETRYLNVQVVDESDLVEIVEDMECDRGGGAADGQRIVELELFKPETAITDDGAEEEEYPLNIVREELNPCTECEETFENSSQLTDHLNSQHLLDHGITKDQRSKRPMDSIHECGECDRQFRTSKQLYVHKKSHQSSVAVKCEICDKWFVNLWKHKRNMHSERSSRNCEICGKEFRNLHSHMDQHKPKKYECTMCPTKVATAKLLRNHMRTHTGDRVKCLFCEHTATTEDNSNTHMRKKHPREYRDHIAEKQKRFPIRVNDVESFIVIERDA